MVASANAVQTRNDKPPYTFGGSVVVVPPPATTSHNDTNNTIPPKPNNTPDEVLHGMHITSERKKNLIALMEVSSLSKPPKKRSTKDLIIRWMDGQSQPVTLHEIAKACPSIAYNGITSRVSEMVRDGILRNVGKLYVENKKPLSLYMIRERK